MPGGTQNFRRPVQPPTRYADFLTLLGVDPATFRMPMMASPATLGPMFHTAAQEDERHYLGTGYDAQDSYDADPRRRDPETGKLEAPANLCRIRRYDDNSADSVRLEATGKGWIDYGGQTPRDMKVVNW